MDSEDEKNRKTDLPTNAVDEEGSKMTSSRDDKTMKSHGHFSPADLHIPASPPAFVTMRQLTEAANAFYNMSLAHEITVDSEFRIERYDPPEDSLEHTVKETMHRAFWDMLRSSLEADPPDYRPALKLLAEIKQSLNGLVLPNQKTLQKLIDSSLNLEAAKSTLEETGHLNLDAYAIQVINLMRQFCAPVRDQEVEALRKIDNPVDAFRNAFTLLEKMHMDLANFTIAQMRPYIRQQAVQYERSKFTSFLDAQQVLGLDGLKRTREWIKAAFTKLSANGGSEPPGTVSASSSSATYSTEERAANRTASSDSWSSAEQVQLTPNNILREAYLELLVWTPGKDWPETMLMDQQRLTELGIQLTNIVTLTSLVLVACNFVASNASLIFTEQHLPRVDPGAMVELKHKICQAGVNVLRSSAPTSTEQRAKAMAEEIVFTVERWLNTIMSSPKQRTRSSVESEEAVEEADSVHTLHLLPESLKSTLESQVFEVVHERHPVFVLMNKRALAFLRSALSAHPPEPLPLPPGFGILSDITRFSDTQANSSQAGCSNTSSLQCQSSQTVPPTMATGLRPRSPSSDPPKRLVKWEHLSLSNLASRLLPLLAHNRHVFGPHYAEIIQTLLLPKGIRPRSVRSSSSNRLSPSRNNSGYQSEPEENTFEMT